eukprot:snap_masked-scaffold312_size212576-processed-gene-0.0 protein:Tk12412 transcript:snap_masked-scaffold312_size212576-processed-gene-0.0-mRNA-1 annotation:"s-adenosylmethionine synthetase"
MGFDADSCAVLNTIGKQSPDINQGVDRADPKEQGAGDQGIMFGYACNETDVLMPAPITYSHLLVKKQAEVRKSGKLDFLRPDAKSQVTFQYDQGKIVGIDAVVLSTQHCDSVTTEHLREAVMEEIIKPVLPSEWLSKETKFFINPTGRFVIGGPMGDCGLTGRKIIVDTYGGAARHGGGAFSAENPEAFLQEVVPHEVSHLIVFARYGKVRPHGKEWQAVMQQVFGVVPNTTHSFDISSVQGETFTYQCGCDQLKLSIRRHNKVQRQQAQYFCRRCKQQLAWLPIA